MTKKTIAFLIESELEKAEVVLAARSMTDAIQKMAETAAKMEAEDLMPLSDPIREHFGPEAASAFSEAVADKLRALVQTLSDTKNAVSDEIARMQGEQVATPSDDLASMDDAALDPEAAPDAAAPEDAAIPDLGADAVPAPEAPPAPRFSDEDLGASNAAGRMRKESVATTKAMLADTIVARQYASMVREGKKPADAASVITETYGIDLSTLIEIMEDAKIFMDRIYKGFVISKSTSLSNDAPYIASGGGDKFRADSLAGVKGMVDDYIKDQKGK